MTTEYLELLRELHSGTAGNRVNWQQTSAEDQFIAYFRDFALAIKYTSPRNEQDHVRFSMHDESGKMIEQFWVTEGDEEWQAVWEIYSGARKRARGIDKALTTILGELKSGKQVGGEPPSTGLMDDDEEVPF
jgi:hypothetical protein